VFPRHFFPPGCVERQEDFGINIQVIFFSKWLYNVCAHIKSFQQRHGKYIVEKHFQCIRPIEI
jgi:hypothetical protein